MPEKLYLSHGLGVDSWAAYLLLIERGLVPGIDFEAVAVNHGTDWPETYEYLEMMQAKDYPVTVLIPDVGGCNTLWDYCVKYRFFPRRNNRWCTVKFKIKPLLGYCQTPCIEIIAFDAGEEHRARRYRIKDDITPQFLLIDEGINRQGCVDIIKRHGLPVPMKSGCWICPFQQRSQWILLKQRHPDLFQRAVDLERACGKRRMAAGKNPLYLKDRPLELIVQTKDGRGRLATTGTQELWGEVR